MKYLTLILISFLSVARVFAQDIKVVSFKLLETDLTAKTEVEYDQNGGVCALVKVVTSQRYFSFDAGVKGVVKTENRPGEIWVYVPAGAKRLSVSHEGMQPLLNFDLGLSLKSGLTYQLVLKTSLDIEMQDLSFKVTPIDAVIMIESENVSFGKRILTLQNGGVSVKVPVGSYKYIAMADGCATEEGTFVLDSESPRKVILELHPLQDALLLKNKFPDSVKIAPISDTVITVGNVSFKMVGVTGGSFTMGAAQDVEATEAEVPSHFVQISTFRIGECEVTQHLWSAVMGRNPSMLRRFPRYPVEMVSWDDCLTFIDRLNRMTGLSFRLPTEAEWEYAARGGNKTEGYKYSGSDDIGLVAWYKGNSASATHEVKTKLPNELGLYDMSGNAFEWCADRYGPYEPDTLVDPAGAASGAYRSNRGGGVFSEPRSCRNTSRSRDESSVRFCTLGLRLAL